MDTMKFAKGHSKVLMKNEQASALDIAREKVNKALSSSFVSLRLSLVTVTDERLWTCAKS